MIEAYEKDCPVCGHKTLMAERVENYVVTHTPWSTHITPEESHFYCYGCGGLFRVSTESKLVKVEG
jgi:C4-type Zn-finger protein